MKRYSKKREAILNYLSSSFQHPSAEMIYSDLKPMFPDLSLATVYRNLQEFKREGKILSLGIINGQERFDGNIDTHIHFICDKCFKVCDIFSGFNPEDVKNRFKSDFEHNVESCDILLHGTCSQCMDNS